MSESSRFSPPCSVFHIVIAHEASHLHVLTAATGLHRLELLAGRAHCKRVRLRQLSSSDLACPQRYGPLTSLAHSKRYVRCPPSFLPGVRPCAPGYLHFIPRPHFSMPVPFTPSFLLLASLWVLLDTISDGLSRFDVPRAHARKSARRLISDLHLPDLVHQGRTRHAASSSICSILDVHGDEISRRVLSMTRRYGSVWRVDLFSCSSPRSHPI